MNSTHEVAQKLETEGVPYIVTALLERDPKEPLYSTMVKNMSENELKEGLIWETRTEGLRLLEAEAVRRGLIGNEPKSSAAAGQGAQMVPIEQLYPNPNNPRKRFDQDELNKLAASVSQLGVLSPILVVQDGEKYRIVAGERRWRAARAAGLKEVPVIIRDLTPDQEFEVMLTENIQRQDLDPIEEAQAFRTAISRGWKQTELAERLGISQAQVANRLRLLKLPEEVQENISREILSAGHGLALVKVAHRPGLVKTLAEKLQGVPVAAAEKVVDNYIYANNYSTPLCSGQSWRSPKFDPDKEGCVKCPDRVLIKTSPNAEHRHPYCLNRKCWEEKQLIAEEAEKKQAIRDALGEDTPVDTDIPELSRLPYNSYERFIGVSVDDCTPCEHIKDALDLSNNVVKICMNPDCMKEKRKAIHQAEIEKRKAEEAAWLEEKKRLISVLTTGSNLADCLSSLRIVTENVYLVYMIAKAMELSYDYSVYEEVYKHFGWQLPEDPEGVTPQELITKLKTLDNIELIKALFIALLLPIDKDDQIYQLTLGARGKAKEYSESNKLAM